MGRYVCNGLDEAKRSTDTSLRPDARPFDFIIIGGGTFGSAIAQDLFANDLSRSHRILVLEGGPFVIPEHVQNMPMLGLDVDGACTPQTNKPKTIPNLRAINQHNIPRREVWAWPGIPFLDSRG